MTAAAGASIAANFLVSVAAAGGGLALGFDVPFGRAGAPAGAPEITAWIVIRPDDTVIIRVARSEMGQGTLTALPMLVAEELECDWSKVTNRIPRPDENLRRNRVWGDFSTGGSRSIRNSQEPLRTAGATAREMLIAAAAAHWHVAAIGVPRSEQHHHPRAERPHRHVRRKSPRQPRRSRRRRTCALRIRRTGSSSASRPSGSTSLDKVLGRPIYGIDVRVPGHALRRARPVPGVQGHAEVGR